MFVVILFAGPQSTSTAVPAERPPWNDNPAAAVTTMGRYRASTHEDTAPGSVHTYTDEKGG